MILVSIYPIYDITKQIGKDRANGTTLLPPAALEHTYLLSVDTRY